MWILLGIEHTKYDIHWAFLVLQKQSKGGAVCSQRLRARGVAPLPGVRRPWKHADTQEGCHGEVTLLPQPRGQSCSIRTVTTQAQKTLRLSRACPCPKGNPSGELPAAAGWHTRQMWACSHSSSPLREQGALQHPCLNLGLQPQQDAGPFLCYFYPFIWKLYTLWYSLSPKAQPWKGCLCDTAQ